MTLKRTLFKIHSWLGLGVGLVIASIGLSGAVLAFEDEWLLALNPGIVSSAPSPMAALSPPELLDRAREQLSDRRIESIKVWTTSARSPELSLAPDAGRARETRHLDARSGALLPKMRGENFFQAVEEWHRWLFLEHGFGKLVTGTLALVLLGLTLCGLYLRWPRPALNWRRWLVIDFRLKGRPFLRSLHLGLGTWALLTYLVFTSTGPYWAFDSYRKALEQWVGIRPIPTAFTLASTVESPPSLDRAWASFQRDVPSYGAASIRLPASSN
jgi:sulfite reductase (NADPH) flavoprotein alpha-component